MMPDQVVYNNPPDQPIRSGNNNGLIWGVVAGIAVLLLFLYMISREDDNTLNKVGQNQPDIQSSPIPQATQIPQNTMAPLFPQPTQIPQNTQVPQPTQIPQATQVPRTTGVPTPTSAL